MFVLTLPGAISNNFSFVFWLICNNLVGTFATAWVMTKFTEPLRLGVTSGIVPRVAKWLGRGGDQEKSETAN